VAAPGKAKLTSPWRDREIKVDGLATDWSEFQPVAKDVRLSIGLASDADHLYLALASSDAPTSMQIIQQGLIVWFDPKGGKKQQLGIRYPVGMSPGEKGQRGGERGGAPGGRGGEYGPPEGAPGTPPERASGTSSDVGRMYARAEADGRLGHFEILADGKEAQVVGIQSAAPFELKTGWGEGTLVYELKIPLAREGDLPGLGVRPGAIVGVGLESPRRSEPAGFRMGGPGGGMTGGMGGIGGGMRGGMSGPGGSWQDLLDPVKVWTTVLLSPAPTDPR
jgi:hypothetical protein